MHGIDNYFRKREHNSERKIFQTLHIAFLYCLGVHNSVLHLFESFLSHTLYYATYLFWGKKSSKYLN
jgi:hypothetical protein